MDEDNYIAAMELGLKPIHLACLEGDLETVIKLACQPGVVNTLTEPHMGTEWQLRETPIKLASLMGHLSIVEFLIGEGATLSQAGLHASSYAADEGFAVRRREFFLETVRIGREHPDAHNTRKTIHHLLTSIGRRSVFFAMRGPRADLGFADYKLAKQGRHIVVYAPVQRIRTDIPLDRSKTIGAITAKGSGEVLMTAHSGFRRGGERDGARCLDTNRYNYVALHHVAGLLGFRFPGSKHDNGNRPATDEHRGRAHAGHVEVLLAAWYALEMTRKVSGCGGGSGEQDADADADADLEALLARMHTLRRATLGDARSAVILIDSQPCATCLKFINHLFQYTGLHFVVKGGVGVGPTLATKDQRNGMRCDTFGDAFPESDGEEELESVAGIMGGPSVIRGMGDADTTEEDELTVIPETRQASAIEGRSMEGPRFSPVLNMDASGATPIVNAAAHRAIPFTPVRSRMQWPIPESRSRFFAVEDPFSDIPSHRPDNHFELLAEYKKKTPVYEFPGYKVIMANGRPHHHQRQQQQRLTTPFTPCPAAGQRQPTPAREKVVFVDLLDDDDDAAYSSVGSNGGSAVKRPPSGINGRGNDDNNNNNHLNHNNPNQPLSREGVFSYCSFEPIAARERDDLYVKEESRSRADIGHAGNAIMVSDGENNNDYNNYDDDVIIEDDEYYYIPKQTVSQQPDLENDGLAGGYERGHEHQNGHEPEHELEQDQDQEHQQYAQQVQQVVQQQQQEQVQVQVQVQTLPSAVRLQQWRYRPPPRAQAQRAVLQPRGREGQAARAGTGGSPVLRRSRQIKF